MLGDARLRGGIAGVAALVVMAFTTHAAAQSWAGGRTRPSGQELVAVDATGELVWPHEAEDVAGDGDTFDSAERSIDIRTAYAVTDGERFWARVHVSSAEAPAATMVGFVFVDQDENANTGGTAAATDVHPGLTTDPTGGGWDAVLVIPADGTAPTVWTWSQGPDVWEQATVEASEIAGETGTDFDPIDIGLDPSHGYLQASVVHELLGVDQACSARLLVRSVDTAASGGGDLDAGPAGACVPPDANDDGVPDAAVPPQCDTDDDCPFDGLCQDGRCVVTELCDDATDCDANEDCSTDGLCTARPGGSCTDDDACDTLLCEDGTCGVCTPGGAECGSGRRCGADGRCVAGDEPGAGTGAGSGAGGGGVGLGAGEEVRGGACTCELPGDRREGTRGGALAGVAMAVGLAALRRRRRTEPRLTSRVGGGR